MSNGELRAVSTWVAAGAALLGAVRGASRTQQTYWFNEVTKVTQWEEPPKYEFIDGALRMRPEPPPPLPPLPSPVNFATCAWESVLASTWANPLPPLGRADKTGHTYWVDPDTQESVWEKPASLSWKQLKDKDGHAYFWNEDTKESQWEKPAVLAWTEHSVEEEL